MIGFIYQQVSYAANVFCQHRPTYTLYQLRLVNDFSHLFTGTLVIRKDGDEFKVESPSDFHNPELVKALTNSLKKHELMEQ